MRTVVSPGPATETWFDSTGSLTGGRSHETRRGEFGTETFGLAREERPHHALDYATPEQWYRDPAAYGAQRVTWARDRGF